VRKHRSLPGIRIDIKAPAGSGTADNLKMRVRSRIANSLRDRMMRQATIFARHTASVRAICYATSSLP
jgi:hypothetical protein